MRFLTGGESHGRGIFALLDGFPSGLKVDVEFINGELARRQMGYGRGARMRIERDRVEIISGVYRGRTTGAPVMLAVFNRDWENWREVMDPVNPTAERPFFIPRPGHADLPAMLKYGYEEMRPSIERSSARETAGRVAAGALCKLFLKEIGIEIASAVIAIGGVRIEEELSFQDMLRADQFPTRCPVPEADERMRREIDRAKEKGDTVGGVFEVRAKGVPPGLGSHTQWDRRLDGRIAQAMMSIQAVKGVSIGCGWDCWQLEGSRFHDELFWKDGKVIRRSNRAGGIEGGITNGEEIVVRCFMKPIPTLSSPLRSFHIKTKEPAPAGRERSDVCAVPAAAVVGEAMLAIVLTEAVLEKFGEDNVEDIKGALRAYLERVSRV